MSPTAKLLSGTGNQTYVFSNSGAAAPMVLAKPANTASGDYLVAVHWLRTDTVAAPAPAGWTLVPPPAGTALGILSVYYKYIPSASAETATSYTWTGVAGGRKCATMFRVTGGSPTSFVGEMGLYSTAITTNPVMPMQGIQTHAPQTLLLGLMGFNMPSPAAVVTDELGMSMAGTPVATTTGSTESILYVGSVQLAEPTITGIDHWTANIIPASGVGYLLALRSADVAPVVSLGAPQIVDSLKPVTLRADTLFGHVDSYQWRKSAGPTTDYVASGKTLSFTAPADRAGTSLIFDVKATDNNGGNPISSPWVSVEVQVRPHQVWNAVTGTWAPSKMGKAWTLHEGQWERPGEKYVAPGIKVAALLAKPTFFIAHRGSGDEFPEHSMEAYEGVLASGGDAIEVSVQMTSDGVLVCHHDATLERITNSTGPIASRSYKDLYDNVRITQQGILGPGQADVRIPRLSDVLAKFMGKKVIFLESKVGAASTPLFALLDEYAASGFVLGDWVVYKQYFSGGTATKKMAHDRGMLVWGYVDDTTTDAQMNAADAGVDLWGVPDFMPLSRKAQIVARGKVVICWQVHRRTQVQEHQSIKLQGQMSSGLLYVSSPAQRQKKDQFATRRKVPGDLWTENIAVDNLALTYDGQGRAFHKFTDPILTTVMGSMCPTGPAFTLRLTMDYAGPTSRSSGYSGVMFSCANDQPFRPRISTPTGGYFASVYPTTGEMTIDWIADGGADSESIAGGVIERYSTGDPLIMEIRVTATKVSLTVNGTTITANDTRHRGGYFHLAQGTADQLARFSAVSVS